MVSTSTEEGTTHATTSTDDTAPHTPSQALRTASRQRLSNITSRGTHCAWTRYGTDGSGLREYGLEARRDLGF